LLQAAQPSSEVGAVDEQAPAGWRAERIGEHLGDRPLNELFLHVFDARPRATQWLILASMHEPFADWHMAGTLVAKLHELDLDVPASFVPAILEDQRHRAANKIVVHYFDRVPDVSAF